MVFFLLFSSLFSFTIHLLIPPITSYLRQPEWGAFSFFIPSIFAVNRFILDGSQLYGLLFGRARSSIFPFFPRFPCCFLMIGPRAPLSPLAQHAAVRSRDGFSSFFFFPPFSVFITSPFYFGLSTHVGGRLFPSLFLSACFVFPVLAERLFSTAVGFFARSAFFSSFFLVGWCVRVKVPVLFFFPLIFLLRFVFYPSVQC